MEKLALEQLKFNEQESIRNAALAVKKKAQKEKAKALLKESVKLAKQKKRDQEKRKKQKAKEKKAKDEKKEAPKAAPKAAPKKKASAKSKKKKNPTKTELRQEIRIILKTADLQTMTAKSVRKSLGIVFGCDLKPRKVEVTALIQECINEDDEYGLNTDSFSSIHLASPLKIEMIVTNNGGGGNYGGQGTIAIVGNEGAILETIQEAEGDSEEDY